MELNFIKNLWNKLNLVYTFDKVILNFSYYFINYFDSDIDYSNDFFIKNYIHKIH